MKQKDFLSLRNYFLGNLFYALFSFLLIPVITRLISEKEFGKYTMFSLGYFIVLNLSVLGLDQGVTRFFHEEAKNRRRVFFLKILKIIFVQFVLISGLLFVFREKISLLLFDEYKLINVALIAALVFFGIIFYFQNINFRMSNKSSDFVFMQLFNQLLFFVLTFVFLFFIKKDFTMIVLAQVSALFVSSMSAAFFFGKKISDNNSSEKSRVSMKKVFLYSAPLLPVVFLFWIIISSDRFFIKYFYGLKAAGIYGAAVKVISIFTLLQVSFSSYWIPVIYEHYKKFPLEREYYKNTFERAEALLFILMTIFILLKDLIMMLFSSPYRVASDFIPFLLFMPVMQILAQISGIGIDIEKKTHLNILSILPVVFFNLCANFFLIKYFGAIGAAFSTGVSFILYFTIKTLISKKVFFVKINFLKTFLSIFFLFAFSFFSTFYRERFIIYLCGLMLLAVNILLYKKTLLKIFFEISSIIKNNVCKN